MGTKIKGGASDHEFLRAARVEKLECERNHNVTVSCVLWVDDTRSVLNVSVSAYKRGAEAESPPLCRYEVSWPNCYVQSFTACLFQAHVKLHRLVEDSIRGLAD